MNRLWKLLAVLPLLAAGTLFAIPAVASPTGPAPVTLESPVSYRDAVYGDFLHVGNSVLRCPAAGEDTRGGGTAADCAAITAGGTTQGPAGYNNGYAMRLADVDDDAATFDSTRATLTVPAGATVAYAQLTWGGHTGGFFSSLLPNCSVPVLGSASLPPAPAAPGPRQQQVRLAVGDRPSAPVPLVAGHYRASNGVLDYAEMYSDWSDVTPLFGAVPTGRPTTVTVGNVWAPSGIGCAGGWSLTVVFGFPGPQPDYPAPRAVAVYNDHLRAGPLRAESLTAALLGGHASTAGVRMAVTAFDGDRGLGEERLSVNDVDVVEPCAQRSTVDFFGSCAQGAVDPIDPTRGAVANNLSVDAKSFAPGGLQDGQAAAVVRVSPSTDVTTVAELVVSQAIRPQLAVSVQGQQTPVRQGDVAPFSVAVTNTGDAGLTGLRVTDNAGAPTQPGESCAAPPSAVLPPGASVTLSCTRVARQDPLHEEVTATADYLSAVPAGTARSVSATAAADTAVIHSDIGVTRVADRLVVRDGQPVTFTVTVTNNTPDNTLQTLRYNDSTAGDCADRPLDDLGPGQHVTFPCKVAAVHESFTSYGVLQGTDRTGTAFPPVSTQQAAVVVIHPQLSVTGTLSPDTVYRGSPVTASFTVTNTGTQPQERLTGVTVTDPALPGCAPEPVPVLDAGMAVTLTCEARPTATASTAAKATGTDETGAPVTAETTASVTVLEPPLTVERTADRTTVRAGSPVTLTYRLHNTGTTDPLSSVTLTDPAAPDCAPPQPIGTLAAGATATFDCAVTPAASVDSVPVATAKDPQDRPMSVTTDPLPLTVLNPALMIGVSAGSPQAAAGADVEFTVAVRNTGDVALALAVTNDLASACDFTVDEPDGLAAGAARTRQCTVRAASAGSLRDTASFTASPVAAAHDTGAPLTGQAQATVPVTGAAGDGTSATGTPGSGTADQPGTSGTATSGTRTGVPGPESAGTVPGGGTGKEGPGTPGKLAYTGVSVGPLIILGTGALLAGGVLLGVARRRSRGR
ncbi:hypothetical protein VA596_37230 [Amycolatopsis sp., V23-08]|uniref:DUF7507 domain-containing protein n=1 Tax=Amycolatopsis heterodermiae TaxID=3110235 RepID=A0ABU5RI03_9PSEU|nr:hypothetical protein [Amycolatopsis sp., V23-08]MEA5365224.1 hypothetical protein [Amycolatopsis sp., V23-08]